MLSNPDYIYFDHPYEPHSEERGKYWATPYIDTRKVFSFMPEDLYSDIDHMKFNCTGFKECSGGRQNILGRHVSHQLPLFTKMVAREQRGRVIAGRKAVNSYGRAGRKQGRECAIPR